MKNYRLYWWLQTHARTITFYLLVVLIIHDERRHNQADKHRSRYLLRARLLLSSLSDELARLTPASRAIATTDDTIRMASHHNRTTQ
jgi:hypothetical protein